MALTRFSELPSDILTEVLTGKHVSYVVIALWKCGDQVLNRKLAKCVTYIDLKDRRLSSTSRYPKLLSQLPNLRYLSLDRGEWPLNGQPWELAAELRLLEGSKLETLRLIEAESVKALHDYSAPDSPSTPPQPIHTQYKNGHSRFLDFQTAFPKLTALKIGPKSFDEFFVWNDFSGLPSNLTWLSTGHCVYRDGVDTHRVMSMLPRSLVTWKLTAKYYGTLSPDASFWADPPPNLTVLGTILCSLRAEHHNFGFLPRTLTTLGVRPASHGSFLEQFSTLPPYVETLNGSISWIPIDISLTKSTTDFRAWGALKHLKKLSLRFSGSSALDFPQFIPSLPETVQSIVLDRTLQSPEWDEMITTFPSFDNPSIGAASTLVNLRPDQSGRIKLGQSLAHSSICWPSALHCTSSSGDSNYRLQSLQIRTHKLLLEALSPLPPNLRSLDLDVKVIDEGRSYLHLRKSLHMPSTLTVLHSAYWSYLWLPILPSTLTSLTAYQLDLTSPPTTTLENCTIIRFPEATETLRIDEIHGSMETNGAISHPSCPFDLFAPMPHLKKLRISPHFQFHWRVLSRLPRTLTSITLALTGFEEAGFEAFINPHWKHVVLVILDSNAQQLLGKHWPIDATNNFQSLDGQEFALERLKQAKRDVFICPHPKIASKHD